VQSTNQLISSCSTFCETTELISRRWLSENAFEVELRRPPQFSYRAGHTIRLIHEQHKRYYALVSAPGDPTLRLCVNRVETGKMASILASAGTGVEFELTGPHGFFNFALSTRRPVLVATDTGIAPFVSMVRSGLKGYTLFHGARRPEELYYRDLVSQAADKYIACSVDNAENDNKPDGLVHGTISNLIVQHLRSGRYDFYLCGWQQMIREVVHLIDGHFASSNVYTEVFY
jgi:benzoate/toluate 1,2-dioxygenase reductase component